jgi:very-short-patch-repair endonuclease
MTRSELETRFLAIIDRHGLPRPKVNAQIEGYEVDFAWPVAGLIVEAGGLRRARHAQGPARAIGPSG